MTTEFNREAAGAIIASFDARPEMLVQILHGLMEQFGWICDDAVRQLAEELNLSRAEVHGVVSYYHDFRTSPPGAHIVKICHAEACQAMGSNELETHVKARLGIDYGGTTADGRFSLEPVYCLGNCACSPAIMIGERVYGRVSNERFDELLAEARSP